MEQTIELEPKTNGQVIGEAIAKALEPKADDQDFALPTPQVCNVDDESCESCQ